jgi:hypothetical protein
MSLALDVALQEIYFNVNGGYMSMEKLYQSAKEEGIKGVSRKNIKEWLQTQNTYIIHKPSRIHYKPKGPMWTDLHNRSRWILWI